MPGKGEVGWGVLFQRRWPLFLLLLRIFFFKDDSLGLLITPWDHAMPDCELFVDTITVRSSSSTLELTAGKQMARLLVSVSSAGTHTVPECHGTRAPRQEWVISGELLHGIALLMSASKVGKKSAHSGKRCQAKAVLWRVKSPGCVEARRRFGEWATLPACADPEGCQSAGFLSKRSITPKLLIPAKPGRGHQLHHSFLSQELAESGMEFGFHSICNP